MRYLLYHSITVMHIYIILILCYFLQDYFGKELEFIKSIPYRRYTIGYGT